MAETLDFDHPCRELVARTPLLQDLGGKIQEPQHADRAAIACVTAWEDERNRRRSSDA
jgi:hypothetical protein